MRKSFDARLKNVWVNLGWYPGDPSSHLYGKSAKRSSSRRVGGKREKEKQYKFCCRNELIYTPSPKK